MEETKKCPNCGREILATAKKCKYCGFWMEPKETARCPVCLEIIPKDVDECPMCHERIRKTDEDASNKQSEPNPRLSVDKEKDKVKPAHANKQSTYKTTEGHSKKNIVIPIIVVALALLIGAFFMFRPSTGKPSSVDGSGDAEHLHSFFFSSLCEPIQSLSNDEILYRRLHKLLKKDQLAFIEDNLSFCSPVFVKLDGDGNSVFSFYGSKNATSLPETYTVNYTDVGGKDGWFEVITVINGKRTQSKEPNNQIQSVEKTEPSIREWHYSGTIGNGNDTEDVEFTLFVDGPGDVGDIVKGFYRENGNVTSIPVSGSVRSYASSATLVLSTPNNSNDIFFALYPLVGDEIATINLDLAICLDGRCESRDADVRLLRDNNLNFEFIQFVSYEGKLFDSKVSYPIGMTLAINTSDHENEIVSGYYYYKRRGIKNFIPINGFCSHGFSSSDITTLRLETIIGNECFTYEDVGNIWQKKVLRGGTWTLYEDFSEIVKNELEFELHMDN